MGDAPIPMRLTCPSCGELHIDVGEFATKPHHTHALPALRDGLATSGRRDRRRALPARLQERGGDRPVTVRPLDPAVIATDRGADRPTSFEGGLWRVVLTPEQWATCHRETL